MNLTAMEFYPVFLGALGLLIGAVKFFLDRTIRQIDRRFDTLDGEFKELTALFRSHVARYNEDKIAMPSSYVRQSECTDRRKIYDDGR